MTDPTLALFCCLDHLAKLVEEGEHHHLLPAASQPIRGGKLCLGQMLVILVLFPISTVPAPPPPRSWQSMDQHSP